MRTILPLTSAIVAAVLLTPAGLATWYAFGTHEPDNALDSPTYMWAQPPQPGDGQRIYFNAITTVHIAGNPNLGILGTSNEMPAQEYHVAMLGVWIDCNGDGYVGMAESALAEYSSLLLLDESRCPPTDGPANAWVAGAHNYRGWVTELVPIAGPTRDDTDDAFDVRIYRDPKAMVWGDYGRPTDDASAGGSCALYPQPRGTYQSTGAAFNYFDCLLDNRQVGLMETWNTPFAGRRVLGQDVAPLYPSNQFVFQDDDDARGSWADRPTFGSDDSAHTMARVFDCSADPTFRAGDWLNQTPLGPVAPNLAHNTAVPALGLAANPGGTIPATVNATNEDTLDDCDTSNDPGQDFYAGTCQVTTPCIGEDEFQGVSRTRKTESDWNLQFTDYARGRVAGSGVSPPTGPVPGGSGGVDPYLGVHPVRHAGSSVRYNMTSMWESNSIGSKTGPGIVRYNLAEGTTGLASARLYTFYAYVGEATTTRGFELPSKTVSKYGSAQCGSHTSGVRNGWECDASKWYVNINTNTPMSLSFPHARPGQDYQLRDVDCYDGNNDLGVPLGTPAYGDRPCP
ncbi:MAG TPA: hypothetical protein VFH78_01245 [Candidatus Thermoplasmatota archaeon]|nr:hypothetical protein [Candidatus Thermoplasmatota archaeon]